MMRAWVMGVAVAGWAVSSVGAGELPRSPWSAPFGFGGMLCSTGSALPDLPSMYYGIDMVPTRRVPGTGSAIGVGRVTFTSSPYGVAVSPEGQYIYDIELELDRLKKPRSGHLTAWVAKSDLSEVERLGLLDDSFRIEGRAHWNKFLLVVTVEPTTDEAPIWKGPIALRGMSRSGMMHTLAGHGPYEKEPCSKYGFR